MKVQSINQYYKTPNNKVKNQPSFNGVYIVKGEAQDIVQIQDNVHVQQCVSMAKSTTEAPTKLNSLLLTPIFTFSQPNVQLLVATGEHHQYISDYIALYRDPKEILNPNLEEFNEKMSIFERAEEYMHQGIFGPMADLLINLNEEAKEQLKRFRFCSPDIMEIETLDAKEVLDAIKKDSFDYVEGKILE